MSAWLGRTLRIATIHIWIVNFHDALGSSKWLEAELRVKRMRVTSRKQHSAKALKVGMLNDLLYKALRKTLATVLGKNVDVREIGERRLVRHDASKADLFPLVEDGKT